MPTYTHADGQLRLLDGSATPFFVEMTFLNADISFPLGRPRPTETPRMNRGRIDSLSHHVAGPDRLEPMALAFSFFLSDTDPAYQKWRDILGLDNPATWTVGGKTWVTAKGKTQILKGGPGARTLETTPGFADPLKRAVHVEVRLVDPDSGGASHIGYRVAECYFQPDQQSYREGDDGVTISCSGEIYGDVTEITAFTAGTES